MHFSTIFQLVFCWPWCIPVPFLNLSWRQGDWRKTFWCHSLFGCTYSFLFHVVGRSAKAANQHVIVRQDVW